MKKLIFFIFLSSCVAPESNLKSNNIDFKFNNDLSFIEFNNLLIDYAKNSTYPNLNN